jgi:hypothetical protein
MFFPVLPQKLTVTSAHLPTFAAILFNHHLYKAWHKSPRLRASSEPVHTQLPFGGINDKVEVTILNEAAL